MRKPSQKTLVSLFLGFSILVSSLPFVPAQAASQTYSPAETITIHARVPLTPEFAFVVAKNSKVSVSGPAVKSAGDPVEIVVASQGVKDKPLKNQKLAVIISNLDSGRGAVLSESHLSDSGEFVFEIKADKALSGKNKVMVSNLTYGEPITLKSQPIFLVGESQGKTQNLGFWNDWLEIVGDWLHLA